MTGILIAIAAVAAFGLFWWKFVWPDVRENFRQLRESERKLGPLKFTALMSGTFIWIGIGAWLSISLDYPRIFGSTCQRKCFIEDYWYSPQLIAHGGWQADLLFIWLWALPVFVGAFVLRAKLRKLRGMKFSLYADDEGPQR